MVSTAPSYGWTRAIVTPPLPLQAERESLARELGREGKSGSDHKASMRTVKPGEPVGTMWVIDEGLKPGEQVVVEGLQKLREGTPVTPKPVHLSGEGN